MVQSQSNPDWWSSGWAEIGYLGTSGNTGAASFREYGDLSAGPIINSAGFLAENRNTAFYHVRQYRQRRPRGSDLSADARQIWRVHRHAVLRFDSARLLDQREDLVGWRGNRTSDASAEPYARSFHAHLRSSPCLRRLFPGEVSLTREKTGMALNYTPHELSEVFFRFGYEEREGTRPLGATFGYPFQNGVTELVEPIEYRTFDVNAGARFKGETLQANLTYAGSFFRNDIPALVWDNPGLTSLAPGAYIPTAGADGAAARQRLPHGQGRSGVGVHSRPVRGERILRLDEAELVAAAADDRLRRDQRRHRSHRSRQLEHGRCAEPGHRARRDQHVQRVCPAAVQLTPQLRFDFEVRNRNEDNKTNYVAFNPLTGQYGYIALDGGLSSFVPDS